MSGQLAMVRGTVTAAKEQIHSVRVDRHSGYGRVNTTPELWLRDEKGQEHRYQGGMFGAAQPGHRVAVVTRRTSGKPVAFANFTTGMVHDGEELTISTSVGSTITSTLGLSVLLALPGALVWAALLDTIGLGDHAFTAAGFQLYAFVLIACVYAGLRIWSRNYRERARALRDEIDRLLTAKPIPATRT
ncbi:hypothetical protein [Jannaschia pohangensis]|uniref:Uncharacterized protein n=1 Tax=Jannaschia pohangensis TaxID=390807 RepID=A0A1I3UXV2_9RHOB|nr:hypothetical protein [Jannaschia pohangensis]SFJ86757.1 hypothetical protein SAMN04488095_0007 [Jannaschia pohangensis]